MYIFMKNPRKTKTTHSYIINNHEFTSHVYFNTYKTRTDTFYYIRIHGYLYLYDLFTFIVTTIHRNNYTE